MRSASGSPRPIGRIAASAELQLLAGNATALMRSRFSRRFVPRTGEEPPHVQGVQVGLLDDLIDLEPDAISALVARCPSRVQSELADRETASADGAHPAAFQSHRN